jgi:hypothetical protein
MKKTGITTLSPLRKVVMDSLIKLAVINIFQIMFGK